MSFDFPCWIDVYTCQICDPELVVPVERVWIESHEEWIDWIIENYRNK